MKNQTTKKKKKKPNKNYIKAKASIKVVMKGQCFSDCMILILPNTGCQNNTAKQLSQKQKSILHLTFHCLTAK